MSVKKDQWHHNQGQWLSVSKCHVCWFACVHTKAKHGEKSIKTGVDI